MRYRMTGADRNEGSSRSFSVYAHDEEDVVRLANEHGVLVEKIVPDDRPTYCTVPFNTTINASQSPDALAQALQDLLNDMMRKGWEYVRCETLDVTALAARAMGMRILGDDAAYPLCVVVFRRAAAFVQE